jgi:tetratricopeptide (TPR) repeat protein
LTNDERQVILADIEKHKRMLEINPQNAFAWDTLGGQYKALGEYEDAINAFQKAVSLDSSKAQYFHHLGLVYAAVERFDDAIAAFELVIEIDPNHSLAHATLGGYYRKKGKDQLAQEYIEKARSLLDADENEYNRACMEAICGNSDRALELLEIALKNKQTYVNWARRDPDFDFIRSDPRFHAMLTTYAKKSN